MNMSTAEVIKRIRSLLPETLLRDRVIFGQQLQGIERKIRAKKGEPDVQRHLVFLEKKVLAAQKIRQKRSQDRPHLTFPEQLPITAKQADIIQAIRENQVVIISGETGCGKSTQIPKMCLAADRGLDGKIGCTQPRRIAAITISQRIAEELGQELGQSVGYKIRFRDKTNPQAYIKIMTDGMLLAETQADPKLYEYDTLIIDEAHERNLNVDFLLGIIKTLLKARPELKLIITSATLDTEKFSEAFAKAPVIKVGGRLYPVDVEYWPLDPEKEDAGELTYIDLAVKAAERLQSRADHGDILIFMPTEQDILETCERLEGRNDPGTFILPLYARLPASQQGRVYHVKGRKIVVATNVAETSLTIPGIKYVIDTGLARISQYLPRTRTTSLPISPISQSSANQRKGRCGRVQDGVCIRLYAEEDYLERPLFTTPEILRSNLAEVILRMIFLGLGAVTAFPFIDRPSPKSVKDGYDLLLELGAITWTGQEHILTDQGRAMARMPLDPRISRMMLAAQKEGCVSETAVIAAALSIQDPRERPLEKAAQADQVHAPFRDPQSDFSTLLNVWNHYHHTWLRLKTQNKMRRFCKDYFLSFNRMREWIYIHEQIMHILKEQNLEMGQRKTREISPALYAGIHRSILSGFLNNIALKKEKNLFQATKGREVTIFPGSGLFNKNADWIVAAEMVQTSRLFARMVGKIESAWLEELGAGLCKFSYASPHWEKKRGEVQALEQVTLFGLAIVAGRSVSYGRIDPAEAQRIFIQSALVEGQVNEPLDFLKHNRELLAQVEKIEEKFRRRNLRVDDATLAEFYNHRLSGIHDLRALKKLIKDRGNDEFLRMQEQDLVSTMPDELLLGQFPDRIKLGQRLFDCFYKFAPGKAEDGVTVQVPVSLFAQVPTGQIEWGIPGLLEEKITALIKGLPKSYRKQLVPVSEKVAMILAEMKPSGRSLASDLAQFVRQRFEADIPVAVWAQVELPDYLKLRVAIVDSQGKTLEAARDLQTLKRYETTAPRPTDSAVWKKACREWETGPMIEWTFRDLPESILLGPDLMAYPGLEPRETGAVMRLFQNPDQARTSHVKGVEILLAQVLAKDLKYMQRNLGLPRAGAAAAQCFGGMTAVEKMFWQALLHRLLRKDLRDRKTFLAYTETVRQELFPRGKELMDRMLELLYAYQETFRALDTNEKMRGRHSAVQALYTEIRADLEALVPRDFLEIYDVERLTHIPRYLKALEKRLERGLNTPEKDRLKADQVKEFRTALQAMGQESAGSVSEEKRAALEELRWLLEEFKVSLFAQELKTPVPVSAKRLRNKIEEIERL